MASSSSSADAAGRGPAEYAEECSLTGLLSDDALLHMMRCNSTRELLSSVALVCRRWRRLCRSFLVYELVPCPLNPSERPWGNLSEKQLLELAVANAPTLERISLHGLQRLRSNDVISLCQKLPRLKELSIISCPCLGREDVELMVNHFPSQLLCLDLHMDHTVSSQCHHCIPSPPAPTPLINDEILRTLHERCPHLQKLDLDSCSQITQQGIFGFLQACHSLTSLDLHSHALGWPDVAKVFNTCKSLSHFSLTSSQLVPTLIASDEDETIDGFSRGCSRGRGLNKRGRDGVYRSEGVLLDVVMPEHLASIRLYSSPHRSVALQLSPVLGMLRAAGHQLRHLHAQGVFNTSWQTISVLCPNLKLLDLSQRRQESPILTEVEEVVLCGLIGCLRNLERIALPAATDRILTELGRWCPKLQEIRFQGYGIRNSSSPFSLVTDRGVTAVAEGCPALRVLSLAGCYKLTISSTRALAFHCRQLRVLILSRCKFRDDAVAVLLPRLSRSLLVLDLVGCKITRAILQAVLQHAGVTSLRVMAISRRILDNSAFEIADIFACNSRLQVKSGSGIVWDGFYHGISFD